MRERQQAALHLEAPQRIAVEYDQHLPSEANAHQHWRRRQKRRLQQRALASLMMQAQCPRPPQGPALIRITRIAPRLLDQGDNEAMAAKGVKDGVADWLGLDDRDERLTWVVGQEQRSKTNRVRIEVYPRGCLGCDATGKVRGRLSEAVCPICDGAGVEAA